MASKDKAQIASLMLAENALDLCGDPYVAEVALAMAAQRLAMDRHDEVRKLTISKVPSTGQVGEGIADSLSSAPASQGGE